MSNTVNLTENLKTLQVRFSNPDSCYIAWVKHSDLEGYGDSESEAIKHLINHLQDELDNPRKKTVGRLKRHKVKIEPEISEWTLLRMTEICEMFSLSQGDLIDSAISNYEKILKDLSVLDMNHEDKAGASDALVPVVSEELSEEEAKVIYAKLFRALSDMWTSTLKDRKKVKSVVNRDCYLTALKLVKYIPPSFMGEDVSLDVSLQKSGTVHMVWIFKSRGCFTITVESAKNISYCLTLPHAGFEISGMGQFLESIPSGLSFCINTLLENQKKK